MQNSVWIPPVARVSVGAALGCSDKAEEEQHSEPLKSFTRWREAPPNLTDLTVQS